MNKQQKIEAIYKRIANKELSFGCRVFHKIDWKRWFKARVITDKIERDDWIFYWIVLESENSVTWLQEKEMEIIGHPVMFGTVLDWFWEKRIDICWSDSVCAIDIREGENSLELFHFWKDKALPLEEQSDDCISFIYNFI